MPTNHTPAIDVHAHVVPAALLDALEGDNAFGIALSNGEGGPYLTFSTGHRTAPIEPGLMDLERRLDAMDVQGVSVQLLSSFIDVGAHHVDESMAPDYARLFNDTLASLISLAPTKFRGLATLPTRTPMNAVAELERVVDELHFVGVEVGAMAACDPNMEPVWQAAADLGSIVLIHPEASTTSTLPYFLGNLVGNPAETTQAAASLIMSGVLERHPDLTLVLVHGGGFLPYQAGRLRRGFEQYGSRFGATLTTSPVDQLRRFYYDTVLHDAGIARALVGTVGADRVLVGTDYPFAMGDDNPQRTVAGLHLSEEESHQILSGNATALLERSDAVRRSRAQA